MKPALPVLLFLVCLFGGAIAQHDVDVEGLREMIHSLVSRGTLINSESLSAVAQSFVGIEKDLLNLYIEELNNAKEAEEIMLQDEISDLECFSDLLINMQALGATVKPAVAEALLKVIDDPAESILAPVVAQWKQAGAVSLTNELKNSLEASISAIREVLKGSTGTVLERIQAKIASLPDGMAKQILSGLKALLEKLAQQQGGFNFALGAEEASLAIPAEETQSDLALVDKVLDREVVRYMGKAMLNFTKAQAIQQVDILLRKDYPNDVLPNLLSALQQSFK